MSVFPIPKEIPEIVFTNIKDSDDNNIILVQNIGKKALIKHLIKHSKHNLALPSMVGLVYA